MCHDFYTTLDCTGTSTLSYTYSILYEYSIIDSIIYSILYEYSIIDSIIYSILYEYVYGIILDPYTDPSHSHPIIIITLSSLLRTVHVITEITTITGWILHISVPTQGDSTVHSICTSTVSSERTEPEPEPEATVTNLLTRTEYRTVTYHHHLLLVRVRTCTYCTVYVRYLYLCTVYDVRCTLYVYLDTVPTVPTVDSKEKKKETYHTIHTIPFHTIPFIHPSEY